MRINSLVIKNFGAISSGRIDFDKLPSVVMVSGRLKSAGASSNGAGKSTIFNAMTWALFGKEMRRRASASRVIRRGEKRCSVRIVLTLDDGTCISVERSRRRSGAAVLLIDDKPYDTATGAQEALERRLGFSFEQFTRTVVFGGDLSAFCRMTPAERTRMLEELLGIGNFLAASERARERLSEIRSALTIKAGKLESLTACVQSLRADIATLFRTVSASEARDDADYQRCSSAIAAAAWKSYTVARKLGRAYESEKSQHHDHAKALAAWRLRLEEAREAVENANEKRSKAVADVRVVDSEIENITRLLKSLKQRDRDRVCPTCHRPFDPNSRPIDFSTHEHEINRLSGIRSERVAMVDQLRQSVDAARRALADIEADQPAPPKSTQKVTRLVAKSAVSDEKVDALIRERRAIAERDPEDDAAPAIHRAYQSLRDSLAEAEEVSADTSDMTRQQSALEFWQRGMARDGIPAMLLDSTAPILNEAVKPLADVLTDGAYSIRFTGAVTRGKADFRVEASNIEGGESYEDLSKGELTRVDLCVLFAIRALMADRASLRPEQVFIDELFDGLDEQGMEYAARLLRSKKLAKQIVFISHHHVLQDAADGVISVNKVNGVARIT